MPIANIALTPSEFDALQRNISDQSLATDEAAVMAQSGLQYVVSLDVIAPEVDLVVAFANHLVTMEGTSTDSNFTAVVSALNNHVINRGTVAGVGDNLNTRLNSYLSDNYIKVTARYQRLSSGAGFIIADDYLE